MLKFLINFYAQHRQKNTKDMIKMDTYVYSEIRAPYLPNWNRKAYLSFIIHNVQNGKTLHYFDKITK